jgi:hypothetical protein
MIDPRHPDDDERSIELGAEVQAVRRLLAPLAREQHGPDLWPAIAARAAALRRSRSLPPRARTARAAAALLGFAATSWLLRALAPERAPAPPSAEARWDAALQAGGAELRPLDEAPETRLLAALLAAEEDRR